MKLNAGMKLKDITEKYPETLSVFSSYGLLADIKGNLIEELGDSLMLKTYLNVKGINQELFIRLLEEKISQRTETVLPQSEETGQRLNFIGYTYCPLKLTLRECFEEVLEAYLLQTGDADFRYHVPSGCGTDIYEDLWRTENVDQLPEIIASVGFGDFFRKEFVDRFVNKGYFKSVPYCETHKEFISSGLIDPDGSYTVYSVFPLVILVDQKKLGKLPVPEKWSDLLKSCYSDNIIIGASHGDIHEDLLLYIYKEHGDEGLRKLAANIKTGWHGAKMAKTAGTNSGEGAAIYVIPWMFAKSCPRTDATKIIWPEDGALTTPTYMLVKESAFSKYKLFIDFLTGLAYGQKSADNYFPAANAGVDNKLPEGTSLKWLGWDYIKSHPVDMLKEHVIEVFHRCWKKGAEMKEMVL